VYGKGNRTLTVAKVPHVTVLDCIVPQLVVVGYSLMPNTEDTFRFMVRVQTKRNTAPFQACSYEWDFGDDLSVSTNDPIVEHGYLERKQRTAFSEFLVQVRLIPCDGTSSLTGRTTLSLMNRYPVEKEAKH